MNQDEKISHKQTRAFKPQKMSKPRDFVLPQVCLDKENNEIPTVLEIGAGKGKHALLYAAENPYTQLIAIERTRNKFEAFAELSLKKNLINLTAIHADALPWIVHAITPKSIERIFLLYPNPEQHNPNQQWLNMPFFEFLLSRLKTEGEIILATNIESYMDNAEQKASTLWCLPNSRECVAIESKRTHFEIKYLARGETCWQLTMTKPKGYITRFDSYVHKI